MEDERIIELIKRSIRIVIEQDAILLINDVNEPAISHKLAQYIEPRFNDYDVDCEYNRNIENEDLRKKIYLLDGTDLDVGEGINIIPDIIIHERGINTRNLCALEIKKNTSTNRDIEYDRTKLKACTLNAYNNLNFQLGILIIFTVATPIPDYHIEVYKNGELFLE